MDPSTITKNLQKREIFSHRLKPVKLLDRNRHTTLWQRDVKGHTGCVNALEFSGDEQLLLSGGDDGGVNLWQVNEFISREEPKPKRIMKSRHYSNIFTLGFTLDGRTAYSAGNDCQFIQHDVETGIELFRHESENGIHRLDVHPTSDGVCCFATDEDGQITIVDSHTKEHTSYEMKNPVFSALYNPIRPELLCISMFKGLFIYDLRNMKSPCMQLKSKRNRCTFGRWTPYGDGIVALMKIDGVSYFHDFEANPILLSDPEFLNSCTMKSCTFVDDDTILCGSDEWNIFGWKLPTNTDVEKVENAYTVLKGHRSIVNHIRYSEQNNLIVSSGVEKIIKCWSPYEIPNSFRDPIRRQMKLPGEVSPGLLDSPDEDLFTLYQFDYYLRQAQNRRKMMASNENEMEVSDDSDDPSSSFIHDILNVALSGWEEMDEDSSNESYAHTEQESSDESEESTDEES